jgi:predicted nucleic acid-binding protein
MEHYLVDTNVVIDMLLDREDADAACAVVDGAERGEYEISLCALSYTNIFYSLRHLLSRQQRIDCLLQLNEVITTVPVDGSVIKAALCSGWKDFEDAVQYFAAKAFPDITGIITRNTKDFHESSLPVLDSRCFLK